jgi:predicted ATP-dependent serine protease
MKKSKRTARLSAKTASPKTDLTKKSMGNPAKVRIHKLSTGVPGLDDILGGGVPEFSLNVVAGAPGCGKTTLVHQIAFAYATAKKPALYFTVLGEPVLKMMRYQQQFSFFDESKLGSAVRFINLSDLALEKDLTAVLEEIIAQVTAANAGVVVMDSFRTLARKAMSVKWRCNRSCTVSPSSSPVGKPRHFWSANMSKMKSVTILCSPWWTALSGCPRSRNAIR